MKKLLQVDYQVKKNFISQNVYFIDTKRVGHSFELRTLVNGYLDFKRIFSTAELAIAAIFKYIEDAHDDRFWKEGIRKMIGKK